MKIFGWDITLSRKRDLSPVSSYGIWHNLLSTIQEPFTGAWQQNRPLERPTLLQSSAVFRCVTGISSDIGKLRIKLTRNRGGIWEEITENSPWLPLLRKPNHYQTSQQFVTHWIMSELLYGNAYVAKERDARGVVNALYVLDPCRVTPLISDSGDVYYELKQDNLSLITENSILIPASEIIHDRINPLFHPLIGVTPLYACSGAAQHGSAAQRNAENFFANRSLPGGMLSAPGHISDQVAARLKATFEERFSGANLGRLFVGGDGLTFVPFTMSFEQSQLVDQLKFAVSDVARAFGYPEYKLGGPLPPYSGNMQALTLSYYTDCLHPLIESLEACLDEGLELPNDQGTELDIDNLLRMDSKGLAEVTAALVGGGIEAPNEGRHKHNLPPVKGGDSPYLQQQNYSLEALAKRDAQADPFATKQTAPPAQPTPQPEPQRAQVTPEQLTLARFGFKQQLRVV